MRVCCSYSKEMVVHSTVNNKENHKPPVTKTYIGDIALQSYSTRQPRPHNEYTVNYNFKKTYKCKTHKPS